MTTGAPVLETLDIGAALDWEAQLFDEVARHPEHRVLKFWTGPAALVAPKKLAAKPNFPAAARSLAETGWPVHIRATGGDVTPQGPGIVNLTHVYTWRGGSPFDISAAYDRLCTPIETALGRGATRGWQPGAFCDGAYNVQWNGLKFAGTAMRFRPGRTDKSSYTVLAHALMLIKPPTAAMIAAVNQFLGQLGEVRVIEIGAHTGLPEAHNLDEFLSRLAAAFRTA